jgi:rare lipoprotein A
MLFVTHCNPEDFLVIASKGFMTILVACAATVVSIGATNAESGIASVYSYKGIQTASGESARPNEFTAAHRTLPFGTRVQVTNRRNGKTVVVRINDRGPFTRGRVIDVTPAAARVLNFSGLTPVSIAVITEGSK